MAAEGLQGCRLCRQPCDPGAAGPTQEGRKRKRGPGWGRVEEASWAGDQSRIVSWSPVADKQLSGWPRQKEGLPQRQVTLRTPMALCCQ